MAGVLHTLIHPAPGRQFANVFAKCAGLGPSYQSAKWQARVYGRFYCHYVVTYVARQATDTCTATIVLIGVRGILNGRLIDDSCY